MATSNKYDRQLRLWGSKGQKLLSETTIVLVGASAVGTETLKNLVLPGVGGFHVVDDERNDGSNKESNFFHPSSSSSSSNGSRAEVVAKYLGELNEDVKADFTHVDDWSQLDFAHWLEHTFELSQNLLVVAADIPRSSLLRSIASACEDRSVPLLYVRSYGLIGMVQVQVQDHFILESKPDNELPDLRLAQPFSDLTALVRQTNLHALDDVAHAHVPFVIILIQALHNWRSLHAATDTDTPADTNHLPSTPQQKTQFRDIVKSMARNYADELNFQEAYRDAYLAYSRRDLPLEVTQLIQQVTQQPTLKNKYQIMLLALHHFMSQPDNPHQQPPLNGKIPDMTSSTQPYIALQNAYKQKAKRDRDQMAQIIQSFRNNNNNNNRVSISVNDSDFPSDDDLDTFCKNIHNIRFIHTRSLADQHYHYTKEEKEELLMTTFDPFEQKPEHTPLLWYIALEACELFYQNHNHYPGKDTDTNPLSLEKEEQTIQSYIQSIATKMELHDTDLIKTTLLSPNAHHAKEMVRYDNAEIHNICSFIGGIASQEAVKLVTKQYVPIENTFIFNGIAGVGAVYKL